MSNERKILKFNSEKKEEYNREFTIEELENAISKMKDTTPEPDV